MMKPLAQEWAHHFLWANLLLLALLLGGCSDTDTGVTTLDLEKRLPSTEINQQLQSGLADEKPLLFGFDLRSSPGEDARQYLPFLKYLESSTGLHFQLRFTARDGDLAHDLGQGKVQLAAIGATTYIKARQQYDIHPLVRGVNKQGRAEYRSMIVVHPDSRLKTLTDLKGRSLAFGSTDSTQGHLIPRIVLSQAGLSLNDLSSYRYTGSHLKCAEAVISKAADACGMQDVMAENLARQGRLRILYRSDFYPSSGIAANSQLPADVVARIRRALLDFKPQGEHRDMMYHWELTEMPLGFTAASDRDYEALRNWVTKLGL